MVQQPSAGYPITDSWAGSTENSNSCPRDRRRSKQAEGRELWYCCNLWWEHYCTATGSIADKYPVRKYVENMPGASQLLDLLAATGSDGIEATKAAGVRQPLYPDVRKSFRKMVRFLILRSTCPLRLLLQGSKQGNSTKDFSMPISTTIWR